MGYLACFLPVMQTSRHHVEEGGGASPRAEQKVPPWHRCFQQRRPCQSSSPGGGNPAAAGEGAQEALAREEHRIPSPVHHFFVSTRKSGLGSHHKSSPYQPKPKRRLGKIPLASSEPCLQPAISFCNDHILDSVPQGPSGAHYDQ